LSGTQRQIDVLMRQQVGHYVMNIVLECKDYKRPVDVKRVEEFHGLLQDVCAQKGALVCPKGFTRSTNRSLQPCRYRPPQVAKSIGHALEEIEPVFQLAKHASAELQGMPDAGVS
jgi:Restriction endonuclease